VVLLESWLGFYGGLTEMVWILCYEGANCNEEKSFIWVKG
jgi:hypothetical protein